MLNMIDMLSRIIVDTFTDVVGKKGKFGMPADDCLYIRFRLPLRDGDDDGYRHRELIIHAPMNYVGVYTRETWDVAKEGEDYVQGASEWVCLGYHDSGWRETVRSFVKEHANVLQGFSGSSSSWYSVKKVWDYDLPDGRKGK